MEGEADPKIQTFLKPTASRNSHTRSYSHDRCPQGIETCQRAAHTCAPGLQHLLFMGASVGFPGLVHRLGLPAPRPLASLTTALCFSEGLSEE